MGKWIFTASNGSVVAKMTPDTDEVNEKTHTFRNLSISNAIGKLRFFESGNYVFSTLFSMVGAIGGETPTDIDDAETKILALIPTASGGGGSYNNTVIYDKTGDLPITFDADTIHSISMLSITGILTVTVAGGETELTAGQNLDIEADGLIADEISIDSTTGTFIVTTIN